MITRTEILYAYGRLQEQDDLPENCNDFMLAAEVIHKAVFEFAQWHNSQPKTT